MAHATKAKILITILTVMIITTPNIRAELKPMPVHDPESGVPMTITITVGGPANARKTLIESDRDPQGHVTITPQDAPMRRGQRVSSLEYKIFEAIWEFPPHYIVVEAADPTEHLPEVVLIITGDKHLCPTDTYDRYLFYNPDRLEVTRGTRPDGAPEIIFTLKN